MPLQKAAIATYGRHRQRVITVEDKWRGINGKNKSARLFSDSSSGDSWLPDKSDESISLKSRKPRKAKKTANKNINDINNQDKENIPSKAKRKPSNKTRILSPNNSKANGSSDSDFFTSQKKWSGVKTFGAKAQQPNKKLPRLFSTDSNASSTSDHVFTPRSCLRLPKQRAQPKATAKSCKKGTRVKAATKKTQRKPNSPDSSHNSEFKKYNFSDFDDYSLIISDSPDAIVQPGLPSVSPLSSSVSTSTPHHSNIRSARLPSGVPTTGDRRLSLPISPLPHNESRPEFPHLADDILITKDLVVELSRLSLSQVSCADVLQERVPLSLRSPDVRCVTTRHRLRNVTYSKSDISGDSHFSGHSSYYTPGSQPALSGSVSLFSGEGDHSVSSGVSRKTNSDLSPAHDNAQDSSLVNKESDGASSPCSDLKKRMELFISNQSLDISDVIVTRQLRKRLLSDDQSADHLTCDSSVHHESHVESTSHESSIQTRLRNPSHSNVSALTNEDSDGSEEDLSETDEEEEEEEELGDILEESEGDQEQSEESEDSEEEAEVSVEEIGESEDEDSEFRENPDDTRYTFADKAQWSEEDPGDELSEEEEEVVVIDDSELIEEKNSNEEHQEESDGEASHHQNEVSPHKIEFGTQEPVQISESVNQCASPVRKQNISLISATSRLSLREALTPKRDRMSSRIPSSEQQVLQQCNQNKPRTFAQCIPSVMMKKCVKIGEGVYGEVFRTSRKNESVALKIIPIEGDFPVNDEPQKKYEEILPEIVISRELSALSEGENFRTCNFVQVKSVSVVKGKYPAHLLQQWDAFNKRKGSENDRPDVFDSNQLFIVFEFEDCGQDLESFPFHSLEEGLSVLQQVTWSLAIAEQALHFEHRDLHWGNVLVKRVPAVSQLEYTMDGVTESVNCHGVKVAVIDFTLSRLSKDGCHICTDLSADPTLFEGHGDYQFDIYRLMKEENGNSWTAFNPYTNVLWLHYLAEKIMKHKVYDKPSAKHKMLSKLLSKFLRSALEYESASCLFQECELFSVLDHNES